LPISYKGMSKSEAKRKMEESARKLDKIYMSFRGMSGVWDSKVLKLSKDIRNEMNKIK